jgi:hypothetical protein
MSAYLDSQIWNNPNYPNKTTQDEDIILLVREDISILIFKAIGLYAIFFVFLILRLFVGYVEDTTMIYFFDFVMYLSASILTAVFIVVFHNYYLSLQIITNERIIDIDQRGLFSREVNSAVLENIEDVTHRKTTVLQLFFNFGDVIVETAGRSGNEAGGGVNGFVFNNVPNPSGVAHLIEIVRQQNSTRMVNQAAEAEAKALQQVLHKKAMI